MAYTVTHDAMITAPIETHHNLRAALTMAQAHLEAYAVLVLYSKMEETQAQRILAAGQEMLEKSFAAIERAQRNQTLRTPV